MKYVVHAIRDEVTQEFLAPSVSLSDERAIRDLESVVLTQKARSEGMFFSHPSDFSLYAIGTFDSEVGIIENSVPRLLRKVGEI